MSQQRSYEGYAYPTEFQGGSGGGGDTYFSAGRSTSPSSTSLGATAGGGGGVPNTGLTRRSAQHTSGTTNNNSSSTNNINFAAAAGPNSNASPNTTGPVTIAVNASSPSSAQYPGTYGYFHHHGNSIDVNSGYNSDAGSSVSNPHYGGGGGGAGGYPMAAGGGAAAAASAGAAAASPSRVADVVVGARQDSFNPNDVSPVRPPAAPRFGGGGGGVFRTGGSSDAGRANSTANSTRSDNSARPPVAPPAFLPSRPFIQSPPLSSTGAGHTPHQHAQPYMVPMPSSMQQLPESHNGHDPLGGSGPVPGQHMVSPSTAGPRMPAMATHDYAHGYGGAGGSSSGGGGGLGGGGAGQGGRVGGGGFLGRMLAQVIPTFDDGNAGGGGSGQQGGANDAGGVQRERPIHQLRFGNPEDDLPLLEELGIFPRHILDKARGVLNPFRPMSVEAAKDTDLAGPILFAFSLALILSLRGKIQFSAIYGLFVLGVGFFKVLLYLMQPKGGGAPLQFVISTVGYGLLPTVLLALVRTPCSLLLTRRSLLPLTLLMILWSAWCGSVLVAKGLGMEEQRYLVLYPMLLFYAAFDALTVF